MTQPKPIPNAIHSIPEPYAMKVRARIMRLSERPPEGCWTWTASLGTEGYGKFKLILDGVQKCTGAHRAAWLVIKGPIPVGLVIDHLCRNRACVNPEHMELVTSGENTRRGALKGKVGRRRTGPVGCGVHGRTDGYESEWKDGYVRWTCRSCARVRRARWNARHAQT